jgi:type I restriction enzyme S subunit
MQKLSVSATTRIGEVAKVISGYAFKSTEFQDNGIPVIKIRNVRLGQVDLSGSQFVHEKYLSLDDKYHVVAGDILVSLTGSHVNRPDSVVGRVARYPQRYDRALLNQRAGKVIVTRSDRCDSGYLYWALFSERTRRQIAMLAHGAANQANVSPSQVESVLIPLPEIETQRSIASILFAYDDLVENNTRRIKILEEMAQALYREWFVHFRFPGHETVKLVDSPFGKTPQGWEVKKLSQLVSTQYGYTESASENVIGPKYVRGMDINKTSYIDWQTVPYCPIGDQEKKQFALSIGDVMVIRMADPGKVGIVEKKVDAIFASYLIRLKIQSPKLSPYFLFYFLTSDKYQGYVTGASTGTTRRSASAGVITDTEMIIPHKDIRQRFEKEVTTLRCMLNNLLDRNAMLRRTRDLLLPKLITGDIEVKSVRSSER